MIFYFSGTGNSLYAAKRIAEQNNERLISIAAEIMTGKDEYDLTLNENELVGFVFPVYAWGPPPIVTDFIKKIKVTNYADNYIFTVITCGANVGNAAKVIEKSLNRKGLRLYSAFSLIMPSNYMIMGDVDSKEDEKKKLDNAEIVLKHINEIVNGRKRGVFELNKGPLPALITAVVNPLFMKTSIQPEKFYADEKCTRCGICTTVCGYKNIRIDEKPKWGNTCTQCLACINYCPSDAIQFGNKTQNKGRYTNPYISAKDIAGKSF